MHIAAVLELEGRLIPELERLQASNRRPVQKNGAT